MSSVGRINGGDQAAYRQGAPVIAKFSDSDIVEKIRTAVHEGADIEFTTLVGTVMYRRVDGYDTDAILKIKLEE